MSKFLTGINVTGDSTFSAKVGVGGGDTSTAQVALKGQQSLLSFIRGTSGDSTFFMSSDSARLYFSHTDIQSHNVIFKIDSSDKSATFNGQVTINPDADSQVIIGNGGTNASTVFAGAGDDLYIGGGASSNMRIFNGTAVQFYGTVDIDLTLNVDGDATFGGDVTVESEHLIIKDSSPELYFHTTGNHVNWLIAAQECCNATLEFGAVAASTSLSTDASTYTPILKLGQSGTATFAGDLYVPNKLIHVGDTNTWIQFETDVISLRTGGNDRLTLTDSAATFSGELKVLGGDVHFNEPNNHTVYIDFPRTATHANPTARIMKNEPAATHTSSLGFYTSNASGSAPNLVRALYLDESQNATFAGGVTATSFTGDGSNLTGITSEWDGTLTGNAAITGSLTVGNPTHTSSNPDGILKGVGNNGTAGSRFQVTANSSDDTRRLWLGTSHTEAAMTITENKVGIGTTTLKAAEEILHLFSSAPILKIQDGGDKASNASGFVQFWDHDSHMMNIGVSDGGAGQINLTNNASFIIKTNNSVALTIDASQNATFTGSLNVPEYIYHDGNTTTYARFQTNRLTLHSGGGAVVDLHSNGQLYFTGTSTFYSAITSNGNVTASRLFSGGGGNKTNPMIANGTDEDTGIFFPAANTMAFTAGNTEAFRIAGANATFGGTVVTADNSADNYIAATFSDSSYVRIHGYGLYMSRNNSYIRPTTDTGKTLYIGSADKRWDNVNVHATNATFSGTLTVGSDITATGADFTLAHAAGATMFIRRDDTSISDGDVIGLLNFQGDDPSDGTFNTGAAIKAVADGTWQGSQYPAELLFQTRNQTGSLATSLTLNKDQSATFAGTVTADNIVKATNGGSEHAYLMAAATGTGTAGMYLDASNGDFSGGDYFSINQFNDLSVVFESRSGAGNLIFKSKGSLNLTMNSANSTFAGDVLAPIFYDSNNTTYFLNPAGTGTALNVAGAIQLPDSKAIVWAGNNILSHNGTQTYIGDNVSSSTVTITGGAATFGGDVIIPQGAFVASQTSTTNPVARFTNTGVNDYNFTFPNNSTIQLGSSVGTDLIFKLANAGAGDFNLDVGGDAAFTGNVTVTGDLSVTGTTTTVNQTNLDVSDNIIGLNRGASSNANDSGIIIERGSTGNNAAIIWDESNDRFVLGLTTATPSSTGSVAIASTSNLAAGNLDVNTISGAATTLTSTASAILILNPTANNYGGVQFNYGGAVKGAAMYNSGMMVFGGESGTHTRLQAGGQYGLSVDKDTRNVSIGSTSDTGYKLGVNGSLYAAGNTVLAGTLTVQANANAINLTCADGNVFLNVNHTGNESWHFKAESASGSTDYVSIGASGGGKVKIYEGGAFEHQGLSMSTGTDVDQIKEFTMTFQLSANTWTDTGINGTDLATGTYAVQVYVDDYGVGGNHYTEYYSGMMSWFSTNTNNTHVDELVLHRAGHAPNDGDIQLRTERTLSADTNDLMLQVKHNIAYTANLDNTGGKSMRFKFRRLI